MMGRNAAGTDESVASMFVTPTGDELCPDDPPLPSCPLLLSPQHDMAPLAMTAQVWNSPAVIVVALWLLVTSAVPSSPSTSTGFELLPDDPSPSWPRPSSPQHFTAPDVSTAHVWFAPAAREATPVR